MWAFHFEGALYFTFSRARQSTIFVSEILFRETRIVIESISSRPLGRGAVSRVNAAHNKHDAHKIRDTRIQKHAPEKAPCIHLVVSISISPYLTRIYQAKKTSCYLALCCTCIGKIFSLIIIGVSILSIKFWGKSNFNLYPLR